MTAVDVVLDWMIEHSPVPLALHSATEADLRHLRGAPAPLVALYRRTASPLLGLVPGLTDTEPCWRLLTPYQARFESALGEGYWPFARGLDQLLLALAADGRVVCAARKRNEPPETQHVADSFDALFERHLRWTLLPNRLVWHPAQGGFVHREELPDDTLILAALARVFDDPPHVLGLVVSHITEALTANTTAVLPGIGSLSMDARVSTLKHQRFPKYRPSMALRCRLNGLSHDEFDRPMIRGLTIGSQELAIALLEGTCEALLGGRTLGLPAIGDLFMITPKTEHGLDVRTGEILYHTES